MKCNKCGSEWIVKDTVAPSIDTCPFCKAPLQREEIDKSVEGVFRTLIKEKGIEVFLNGGLINAYLSDLSKEDEKGRKWIKTALNSGCGVEFHKAFVRCNGIFDDLEIKRFQLCVEESGFGKEFVDYITSMFLNVAGIPWKLIKTKEEDTSKKTTTQKQQKTDSSGNKEAKSSNRKKREKKQEKSSEEIFHEMVISQISYIPKDELEKLKIEELRDNLQKNKSGGLEFFYGTNACIKLVYLYKDDNKIDHWIRMSGISEARFECQHKKVIAEYGYFSRDNDYFSFVYRRPIPSKLLAPDTNALSRYINSQTKAGMGYVYSYITPAGIRGASPDYWFAHMMCKAKSITEKPERIEVEFKGDGTWQGPLI